MSAKLESYKRAEQHQYIRWIGLGFLLACLLILAWVLTRQNPLVAASRDLADALLKGNPQSLSKFMSPLERDCSNLTEERLALAWQLLLSERIRRSELVRLDPPTMSGNDTQATAGYWLKDANQLPWSIMVVANQTDNGPKTPLLWTMLVTESQFNEHGSSTETTTVLGLLHAVRRHRRALSEIGIEKVMMNPRTCLTWDQLESFLAQRLPK